MKPNFIVRVPFKSAGIFYPAGSLLEDLSAIKLAKIKLNERKIVPIPDTKDEFQKLHDYFSIRHKTDLRANIKEFLAKKGSDDAESEKPLEVTPPPGTTETPPKEGEQKPPVDDKQTPPGE